MYTIETLQLGIYRVLIEKNTSSFLGTDFNALYERAISGTKIMRRLITDVVRLAPGTVFLIGLVRIWDSIENVILLSLETRILHITEAGLSDGRMNGQALVAAICTRLLFVVFTALVCHWSLDLNPRVERKVTEHFDQFLLTKHLATDLPTAQANICDTDLSSAIPWHAFNAIYTLLGNSFGVLSELGFVAHIARSGNHGPIFAFLCILRPITYLLTRRNLWSKTRIVQINNNDYVRMKSLQNLEEKSFRMEVITSNIAEYIIQEFRKARDALSNTPTEHAETLYSRNKSPFTQCVSSVVGDFPVLYYAAVALMKPSNMSLTTIATLQQASTLLRWSFWDIFYNVDQLRYSMSRVQQLYDLENTPPAIKDGCLSYPTSRTSDKGMAFELRNVSFTYPGSKSSTKALDDVSFRVDPGQLVVIVGANGSGKSTFIKLITRLYDADTGSVIVDGEDVQDYKIAELRQGVATITQDHRLYPLSIRENIGLGYPEAMENTDLIKDAARRGGAEELIGKLSKGIETILDPYTVQYGVNIDEDGDSELAKELKELSKSADVSGGEKQRIVAARTFMRFNSQRVKFVAVDEPSSALDAEAELALFDNLREMREGKTMVFVTHRFGHLTRHADKILCMKDGKVVESGSHVELMELGGEYFKLYDIQAKAFEGDKS